MPKLLYSPGSRVWTFWIRFTVPRPIDHGVDVLEQAIALGDGQGLVDPARYRACAVIRLLSAVTRSPPGRTSGARRPGGRPPDAPGQRRQCWWRVMSESKPNSRSGEQGGKKMQGVGLQHLGRSASAGAFSRRSASALRAPTMTSIASRPPMWWDTGQMPHGAHHDPAPQ